MEEAAPPKPECKRKRGRPSQHAARMRAYATLAGGEPSPEHMDMFRRVMSTLATNYDAEPDWEDEAGLEEDEASAAPPESKPRDDSAQPPSLQAQVDKLQAVLRERDRLVEEQRQRILEKDRLLAEKSRQIDCLASAFRVFAEK